MAAKPNKVPAAIRNSNGSKKEKKRKREAEIKKKFFVCYNKNKTNCNLFLWIGLNSARGSCHSPWQSSRHVEQETPPLLSLLELPDSRCPISTSTNKPESNKQHRIIIYTTGTRHWLCRNEMLNFSPFARVAELDTVDFVLSEQKQQAFCLKLMGLFY